MWLWDLALRGRGFLLGGWKVKNIFMILDLQKIIRLLMAKAY